MTAVDAAAWHDVECAAYAADVPLWRELAAESGGPVLDVGCGTGRVALDLAERGHEVTGVDADPVLVAALNARASERALPARAETADARALALDRRFPLAIAPMQVVQLLGGSSGRAAMLASVARHLDPGGLLAVALADPFDAVPAGDARPPLPDVLEVDGWVLSSTPVAVRDEPEAVAIDRVRQAVSPAGELTEELATIVLDSCAPATLEHEAAAAGLRPAGRRQVPPTLDYVGSAVVLLEAQP
ncbi:MAG: class I SAM-dependent methyltransferase [Thermoleophilaceae bacterium]